MSKEEPTIYDNSKISKHISECNRKYYYEYILRIKPLGDQDPKISFGSVLHEGLAAFYDQSEDPNLALAKAYESPEISDTLIDDPIYGLKRAKILLKWYMKQEPLFEAKHVEIGLTIDLTTPEDKRSYMYGGKMDIVGSHSSFNGNVIVDHKITQGAVPYYQNNLLINRQMTGYILGTLLVYGDCHTAIINAVNYKRSLLKKATDEECEFYANYSNSAKVDLDPYYSQHPLPMTRTDEQLEGWITDTKYFIDKIEEQKEAKHFPLTGDCGTSWSACGFLTLCAQFPEECPSLKDCQGYERAPKWEPWNDCRTIEEIKV